MALIKDSQPVIFHGGPQHRVTSYLEEMYTLPGVDVLIASITPGWAYVYRGSSRQDSAQRWVLEYQGRFRTIDLRDRENQE